MEGCINFICIGLNLRISRKGYNYLKNIGKECKKSKIKIVFYTPDDDDLIDILYDIYTHYDRNQLKFVVLVSVDNNPLGMAKIINKYFENKIPVGIFIPNMMNNTIYTAESYNSLYDIQNIPDDLYNSLFKNHSNYKVEV